MYVPAKYWASGALFVRKINYGSNNKSNLSKVPLQSSVKFLHISNTLIVNSTPTFLLSSLKQYSYSQFHSYLSLKFSDEIARKDESVCGHQLWFPPLSWLLPPPNVSAHVYAASCLPLSTVVCY